nr:hypothetical protein [Tanacetum cinerariifolium]
EEKDDDVEKTGDATEEKDNADHINQTLVGTHATSSMETRNEQMQTPIPKPNRSTRKDLSADKKISKELTKTISPTTAITSKSKSKREFTSNKTKILPGSITGMVLILLKGEKQMKRYFGNYRYEPTTTTSAPKKGATNVSNPSKLSSMLKTVNTSLKNDNFTTSNSFSALNDEEEDDEEVENVYNESANLVPNINTDGSSSFTGAAG